ncbi:MAG: hypothetical protein Q8L48_23150 [Archangium sp.]|nr:hypothetical protein [Archangium sp.]
MKRFAVAILAMLFVTGCGVGADESYDGQTLIDSNGQALETGPAVGPELPSAAGPQTPETTAPSPVRDPSTVALPQDPIPVFEGRPAQPPPPMVDPSGDPMMGPSPRPTIR